MFGAVLLTKNANHDKYGYDDYDIGFDVHSNFSVNAELGRNVITFGVDNSLVHTVNRKKIFFSFLWRTNGLEDTTTTAEAKYFINITKSRKKINGKSTR